MPNLFGKTLVHARSDPLVRRLELALLPRYDSASEATPDTITSQSIAAGAPVKAGSRVEVSIATGVFVPPVVGIGIADARILLEQAGLRFQQNAVQKDTARPGVIVDQTPAAKTKVARGSIVSLDIAAAPPMAVPDVKGRTRAEAERVLRAAGLTSQFENDPNSDATPDTVSGQQPLPGTSVTAGTTVRVAVATGVVVPPVIDLTASEARQRITGVGLRAQQREVQKDTAHPGTVADQTPAAQTKVARGSTVSLDIAAAPPVIVPDILGQTRADAERILRAVRLPSRFEDDPKSDAVPGTVSGQQPVPGTPVTVGTAVSVAVATGVQVPAVVDLTASEARRRITGVGLKAQQREVQRENSRPGIVVTQEPVAGTRVARGLEIVFDVAVNSLTTVPNVIGLTRAEAAKLIQNARLIPVFGMETSTTGDAALVLSQSPKGGTSAIVGASVQLTFPADAGRPWVKWLVGVFLVTLVTYRLVRRKPNGRTDTDEPKPKPRPPDYQLETKVGETTQHLKASDSRLVSFEVSLRPVVDLGRHNLKSSLKLVSRERRTDE